MELNCPDIVKFNSAIYEPSAINREQVPPSRSQVPKSGNDSQIDFQFLKELDNRVI